jgi:hypothetical protein
MSRHVFGCLRHRQQRLYCVSVSDMDYKTRPCLAYAYYDACSWRFAGRDMMELAHGISRATR